jgi:acyl carrier protein
MDRRENILNEITLIFRKELEDEHLAVSYDSSAGTIEKWDSITNLVLISSIEEKFNVVFPIDFIFRAENVGDLCDFILENAAFTD